MNKVMERVYKIIPKYAILPMAVSILLNVLTYFGTRLFTTSMYHYDISTYLDHHMPLWKPMMVIYVLAYVHWIVGYIVIGRENKEVCYKMFAGEQIAKLICLAFFIFMPTTMERPDQLPGTDFFTWLTNWIYAADAPDNLFPSIHCLESWMVFRGAMYCKKTNMPYKVIMFICAILVFASTVLVHQHLVLDIAGGIAVVEIGILVSKKFNLSRIYYALERKSEEHE